MLFKEREPILCEVSENLFMKNVEVLPLDIIYQIEDYIEEEEAVKYEYWHESGHRIYKITLKSGKSRIWDLRRQKKMF